ncbi:MAG: DNA/RNA non-specific endonuclease [Flavobacterium sp.]|nr:DNA/RNA non-specific endonuclease [Flavobacterium sp.]
MKKKYIFNYILFLQFCITFYSCKQQNTGKESFSVVNKKEIESVNYSNNPFDFLPTSTTNQIVKHEFYTLSYNEKYEQAEWVTYELKDNMVSNNHFDRPFFIEDNLVKTHSADWRNYKKSGYDKGHQCPAGDMKFNKKAFDDTFFTSNICPQKHDFNDGVWNRLEGKIRYWAQKYKSIYVVTGSILKDGLPTIGRENVAIPEAFYKVLLRNENGNYKIIAFLVPSHDSDKPLYEFVIATDDLEKVTGINFYPNLPDNIENQIEKNANYNDWSF